MLPRRGHIDARAARPTRRSASMTPPSRGFMRACTSGAVVRVEDLGSANGTRVGGVRLRAERAHAASARQVVEIGSSWMMIANAPLSGSTTRQTRARRTAAASRRARRRPARTTWSCSTRRCANMDRLIERAALSDISVLLLGETGVGKEVFARRIHALSPRASEPFLGLNCAALAASLLESELFGHERGRSPARARRSPGCSRPPTAAPCCSTRSARCRSPIQVKLLRVLEERQVLRIGGTRPRPIDVRVLSATNRNLEAEVAAGSFRRDLVLPPQQHHRSRSRRCASARRRSSRSRAGSRRWRRSGWACAAPGDRPEASGIACVATDGPATSASCAT